MVRKRIRTGVCLVAPLVLSGCLSGGGGGEAAESSDNVSQLARDNKQIAEVASSTEINSSVETDLEPVGDCALSVLDQAYLIKLNEVRAQARMCGDTHYEAVDPVVWNCTLEGAALTHSRDMGQNNFFSHTGSDGLRVGARADDAGYNWVMVGENIAVGYSSVSKVMDAWLDSPSHCRTIMNGNYTETAMSLHLPSGKDYSSYWTMLMGKPASF